MSTRPSQAAEATLYGVLFDQSAGLIGQIGDEADLLGIGVAYGGVELCQTVEAGDVIAQLPRATKFPKGRGPSSRRASL